MKHPGRPAVSLAVCLLSGAFLAAGVFAISRSRRGRFAQAVLPRDGDVARLAAARIGLSLPDACMDEILANLALLDRHIGIMRGVADR